jgi:hypothetical protein
MFQSSSSTTTKTMMTACSRRRRRQHDDSESHESYRLENRTFRIVGHHQAVDNRNVEHHPPHNNQQPLWSTTEKRRTTTTSKRTHLVHHRRASSTMSTLTSYYYLLSICIVMAVTTTISTVSASSSSSRSLSLSLSRRPQLKDDDNNNKDVFETITASGGDDDRNQEYYYNIIGDERQLQQSQSQQCWDNLYVSDVNGDMRVDAQEYVTFVKLEGPTDVGFLDGVTTFAELPLTLQSNFLTLACFCNTGRDCCQGDNAHLSTAGTAPGTTPTPEELTYLNLVCTFTSSAIGRVVAESFVPTFEPSSSPTTVGTTTTPTTSMPITSSPTAMPSLEPTTQSPTMIDTTFEPTTTETTLTPTTLAPSIVITQSPTTLTTSAPTITSVPTTEIIPVPIVVKTTYSIVVVNGITTNVSSTAYEPDLIIAMNILAEQVAININENDNNNVNTTNTTTSSSSATTETATVKSSLKGPPRRKLNTLQQSRDVDSHRTSLSSSSFLRRSASSTREKQHHDIYSQHQHHHRKLEVVVDIPTSIDENIDVGYTDDPQLVDGVFVSGPCPFDLQVSDDDAASGSGMGGSLIRMVDPATDYCQQITASISLLLTEGEDPIEYFSIYLTELPLLLVECHHRVDQYRLLPPRLAVAMIHLLVYQLERLQVYRLEGWH